ncbi:MAG: hypothetical protein WDN29_09030 [Methylovirgula sp.]
MVRLQPIVGIQKTDSNIILRNGEERADAACRIAIIAMPTIEPDVPNSGVV